MSSGSVGHMDMQSDRSSPGHSELSELVVVVSGLGFSVVVVGLPLPPGYVEPMVPNLTLKYLTVASGSVGQGPLLTPATTCWHRDHPT